MSFSQDVKEELTKQFSKSRHCQIAELAAILELAGGVDENGRLALHSENPLLLQKYALLMRQLFFFFLFLAMVGESTALVLDTF